MRCKRSGSVRKGDVEIIPDKGINSLQIANLAFIISNFPRLHYQSLYFFPQI